MEKKRMKKLAGISEGSIMPLNNGRFKLERFNTWETGKVSPDGEWCESDAVAEFEAIANKMYDILNELVEDYYVHSDVDLKIVAQEARRVIKKAKSL